jgi:hypothetical protein
MNCIKCGADITQSAKFCLKCGASQASKQFEATPLATSRLEIAMEPESETTISSSPFFSKLQIRYQDAYAVARGLVTTGKIIKIAALGAGSILVLIGIILFAKDEGMLGGLEGLLLILLAGMVAGGGFITGILTAAIGQFMSATIDTAVNTSKSITGDEKAEILGLTE